MLLPLLFAMVMSLSLLLGNIPAFLAQQHRVRLFKFSTISGAIFFGLGIASLATQDQLGLHGSADIAITVALTCALVAGICVAARLSLPQIRSFSDLPLLFVTGAIAASIATVLKVKFGGWFILYEGGLGILFGAAIAHVALRAFAISTKAGPAATQILLLSDVIFVLSALFRWDVGDGPDWLVITAMLHGGPGAQAATPPAWLHLTEGSGVLYNISLYIPLVLCWIVTAKLLNRQSLSG